MVSLTCLWLFFVFFSLKSDFLLMYVSKFTESSKMNNFSVSLNNMLLSGIGLVGEHSPGTVVVSKSIEYTCFGWQFPLSHS